MQASDEAVLQDYPWAVCSVLPQSVRVNLEATLLMQVIGNQRIGWYTCARLLNEDSHLQWILRDCWRTGSFRDLRSHRSILPLYSLQEDLTSSPSQGHPSASSQSNLVEAGHGSPRVTGTGNLNFQGCRFTEVHGNLVTYNQTQDSVLKKWLSELDYGLIHRDVSANRVRGTGIWFLETTEFIRWTEDNEWPVLWCPGMPGVGKSAISSLVFDYLPKSAKTPVCVLYFNYKRRAEQTLSHVFASILRQLYDSCPLAAECTSELYNEYVARMIRPPEDEVYAAIQQSCTRVDSMHLVIDGLDEFLPNYNDNGITTLVRRLLNIAPGKIKLMATSRVLGQMESIFGDLGALRCEIFSVQDDIELYLQDRISQELGFLFPHSAEVIQRIMHLARGRFLLAQLHLSSISGLLTWGDIRHALDYLTDNIDLAYKSVMARVLEQDEHRRELALRVLLWVACARRNLSVKELQHALAIAPNRQPIEDYLYSTDTITGVCAGLVVLDQETGVVKFVHQTAQEFFDDNQSEYFSNANEFILNSCFLYLSHLNWADITNDQLENYPFAKYVTTYWIRHLREHEQEAFPNLEAFIARRREIFQAVSLHRLGRSNFDSFCSAAWADNLPPDLNEEDLKMAATWDLPHLLCHLMYMGLAPRTANDCYEVLTMALITRSRRTSCILVAHARTQQGWESVVNDALLQLARGSVPEVANALQSATDGAVSSSAHQSDSPNTVFNAIPGHDRYTTLFHATMSDNVTCVFDILNNFPDEADLQNDYGQTLLAEAAWSGAIRVVAHLIGSGFRVNINSKDHDGRTPIMQAVKGGHVRVVQALLEKRAAPADRDNRGNTPLCLGVLNRRCTEKDAITIIELLLTFGAPVDEETRAGRTALSFAAERGRMGLLEVLYGRGANIHSTDARYQRTPLSYAFEPSSLIPDVDRSNEQWEAIRFLLDREANLHATEPFGMTPLQRARNAGNDFIISNLRNYLSSRGEAWPPAIGP